MVELDKNLYLVMLSYCEECVLPLSCNTASYSIE